MEQNNFKALLLRTVAIPFIALAILMTVLLCEIQSLKSSMQWVDRTDQGISAGQELIKQVLDMETGVRGYLNTGRAEFLQPYIEANSSIDSKFDALNQLVSDNPAQQARLAAFRSRFNQWRFYSDHLIELGRSGEQRGYEINLQGKQLMDSVRSDNDAFIATEEQLRAERVRAARDASWLVTITCGLLSLGIGGFLVFFTRRRIQKSLEMAEKRVEELCESAEALRSSQAKLEGIVGSAMDAVVSVDEQQRIVVFNRAAEAVFHCAASEAVGSTLDRFIPKRLREVHHEHIHQFGIEGITARSMSSPGILTAVRSTGEEFPIEATISQVQADGENIYTVILRDITVRKQAEEALRESEVRFRALVTASSDVVYRMSPDWSEMRQLRGRGFIADTGAPNRTWLQEYIHPDDQSRVMAVINEAIRTKSIFELEHRVVRVDGSTGWTFSRAIPVQDSNGEIVEWFGAASDVTERKRAEVALRASEQRWATTLQSIGDAVISTDATGHVEFMNDVAQRLTGWSLAEAKGRDLSAVFNIVTEVTRIKPENPVAKVIRLGKVVGMASHTALIRRDGTEIPIESRGAPIHNREGHIEGVVLVFHDVSEPRKVEKALRNSDRLATTGRLAATLAHEIHNPLDTVGNLLFLIGQGMQEGTIREYVSVASQELARVTQMTQQMLAFQREAAKPIPVKIGEILDNVIALYERKLKLAGINLTQEVDFDGHILALPGELRQMFANLVGNAIEAVGPRHGTITLRAYASRDWQRERTGLRVVVADNGPGIPADVRSRIFEPFFTTKGESGTGLGLWITSDIIRKYDGTMRLRTSTQSRCSGTCFSVFFPYETSPDSPVNT